MTRILQLLIALMLIPAIAFSQGFNPAENNDDGWEFKQFVPPDTSIASVHGLAFDGDGNMWAAGYYATTDDEGRNARDLRCVAAPDYEEFCDNTPVFEVEHADSTLRFGRFTGLASDDNGHLIGSMDSYLFEVEDEDGEIDYELAVDRSFIIRIDHETHELLDIYEPANFAWHVAVDENGYVFASDVVNGQEIKILDPDLEPLAVVDGDRPGITRDIAVSNDGTRVYQPHTGNQIDVYYSEAGPFGEYEKVDSLALGSNSAAIDVCPVTDRVFAAADGIDWGIGVDPEEYDPWAIMVFDPEEDHEIVEEFYWFVDMPDEDRTDDDWPVIRTNAVHPDGDKYIQGSFGGFGIQMHQGPQVVSADDEVLSDVPEGYELEQNYPNPFNPATNIEFTIPQTQHVTLTVYDMLGRQVEVLVDERVQSGTHTATFNAGDIASGTYIYRLSTGDFQISRQMMFVK